MPWSEDGTGAYMATPAETRAMLEKTGFEAIVVEDTGAKYLAAYRMMIEKVESGDLPPLGPQLLLGQSGLQKLRNSAKNLAEGRTHPIQLICRKPG